jgi:hypothetical protein
VAAGFAAALALEWAARTRGRLLLAACLVIGSVIAPIVWAPDASAWLRANPLTAWTVVMLGPGWRTRSRAGLFTLAFMLGAANLIAAALHGP